MTTTVTKESLAARIAELESGARSLKEDYTLAAYKMLLATMEAERVKEDLRHTIEALAKLNNNLYRWTSRMSYNGSWVGEPEGLIKGHIREMEHILDSCRDVLRNRK